MAEVTVRELRNQGGKVLDRVESGETLTVTRDGRPVAELRPISTRHALDAATVVARARHLRPLDLGTLRSELDEIIDPRL
jgi:prevent-host-death family protein